MSTGAVGAMGSPFTILRIRLLRDEIVSAGSGADAGCPNGHASPCSSPPRAWGTRACLASDVVSQVPSGSSLLFAGIPGWVTNDTIVVPSMSILLRARLRNWIQFRPAPRSALSSCSLRSGCSMLVCQHHRFAVWTCLLARSLLPHPFRTFLPPGWRPTADELWGRDVRHMEVPCRDSPNHPIPCLTLRGAGFGDPGK
jgi:hypothetical protein